MQNFIIYFITLILLLSNSLYSQNTILWSIEDSRSNHKSYLIGTYHQIGNSFIDSIPQIKEALFSSDLAIFESIENNKLKVILNKRAEDFTYLECLNKSDLQFLDSISSDWAVPISKLKPIELLIKLQQVYYQTQCNSVKKTDKWNHFDDYLIHLAKSKNVQIVGLESASIQTSFIENMGNGKTWKQMKKPIHTKVKNISKSRFTDSYCENVMNYMSMSFDYQFDIQCNDNPMLKGRNVEWMMKIPQYLSENKCFIAVGLLHLYGDCGLIAQLRNNGFIVTAISLNNSTGHNTPYN